MRLLGSKSSRPSIAASLVSAQSCVPNILRQLLHQPYRAAQQIVTATITCQRCGGGASAATRRKLDMTRDMYISLHALGT